MIYTQDRTAFLRLVHARTCTKCPTTNQRPTPLALPLRRTVSYGKLENLPQDLKTYRRTSSSETSQKAELKATRQTFFSTLRRVIHHPSNDKVQNIRPDTFALPQVAEATQYRETRSIQHYPCLITRLCQRPRSGCIQPLVVPATSTEW